MKLLDLCVTTLNESNTSADYSRTEEVSSRVYPYLEHEIKKLNRRANKLGTPPIKIEILDTTYKKVSGMQEEKYYKVRVTGEPPHVPGYTFLATIQHKDGGNIIRAVPGTNANFSEFHDADPSYCDYCKKVRKRIDTYIVREDSTGEMRQVGRNCLADFLGGTDPKAVLYYFSLSDRLERVFSSAEEYDGPKAARAEYSVGTDYALTVAAYFVKKYGYVSANASGTSTADNLRWFLFQNDTSDENRRERKRIIQELEDNEEVYKAYVKEAKEWFDSVPDDEKRNNNFLHNLDVALKSSRASYRDVGIVGALFAAYLNHKRKKEANEDKLNDHVGNPGEKTPKTEVTVKSVKYMSNPYGGSTQLVKMEDTKGRSYTWWNSGAKEMEADTKYMIIGTIKKHDEYRGRKTTVVTRVKFQEI
jgi:hypothetical protein